MNLILRQQNETTVGGRTLLFDAANCKHKQGCQMVLMKTRNEQSGLFKLPLVFDFIWFSYSISQKM
jgi:hypothetical protein